MKQNLQSAFSTRQHMVSSDFELYYYNDTHMRHVREHTHDYYEFYFFLGGSVAINITGTSSPLHFGDVVLIPPGTVHCMDIFDSDIPYERFVFWISRSSLETLLTLSPDYGLLIRQAEETGEYIIHFDLLTFTGIESKILALLEEMHSRRYGRDAKIFINVCDLMLTLCREYLRLKETRTVEPEQTLYENLLAYVNEHPEEDLSLDTLAERFFVSKYHLSHVFKEHMGLSLHQYILRKRLALSCDLILSGKSVDESCRLSGFSDYTSFFRAFKKTFGVSPKAFRASHLSASNLEPM